MMKNNNFLLVVVVLFIFMNWACSRDDADDIKPEINMGFEGAFPLNCDTLWLGETFTFKARFSDNAELGSFSIEIHENFDHHAHSTEIINCELDPVKSPVNPFHLISDWLLPLRTTHYEADMQILIPEGNSKGSFDEGDYHLFISLIDREGWSTQKGLSIKIYNR
jgi:hypothetical protein